MVVARASVQDLHMYVRARPDREPFEEVVDELCLQIADALDLYFEIDRRVRPAAKVDGGHGQRLVHRHDEVAGAVDAAPIAERRRHRLAEGDAEILDGVMLVDVQVPNSLDLQVERTVP